LGNCSEGFAEMSDPRVFFAAERTLLAWVRTGLTLIALGFVVARFGLLLAFLAASSPVAGSVPPVHPLSGVLGIGLVFVGSAIIPAALHNHRLYVASLPPQDIPRVAVPWLASFLSISVAMAGFLLAAYLIFT
jgi:putative membrane protein